MKVFRITLQYGLGLLLLATGMGKLLDVPGFIEVIDRYQISAPRVQPFVAVMIVLTELRISELLIRGRKIAAAAIGSVVLHSLFTVLSIITLIRGIEVANCGCFGVFLARPLTPQTVVEDLILVAISLGLYFLARERRSA